MKRSRRDAVPCRSDTFQGILGSPFQSAISAFISPTRPWTAERVIQLADWIESHLDLERLLQLTAERSAPAVQPVTAPITSPMRARIGIARDAAFCFYYEDNLSLLRGLGAELVEFSPIADRALPPELDGIYLGGGYPELHAPALSANTSMQSALREFAAGGAPIYAECGGFMDLTEAIVDVEGQRWPMAGIFPTSARMQRRLAKLGYVEVEGLGGEDWLASGESARGHEFRYSTIDPMPARIQRVYRAPVRGLSCALGARELRARALPVLSGIRNEIRQSLRGKNSSRAGHRKGGGIIRACQSPSLDARPLRSSESRRC